MRISRALSGLPGVEAASLMIGTPSNRDLLSESELLDMDGAKAQADDLIIAVRAGEPAAAEAALAEAEKLLAGTAGDDTRRMTIRIRAMRSRCSASTARSTR